VAERRAVTVGGGIDDADRSVRLVNGPAALAWRLRLRDRDQGRWRMNADCLLGSHENMLVRALPGTIGALTAIGVSLWIYPMGVDRWVRRLYAEGSSVGLLGNHTLTLEADGLRETSDGGESFHIWPSVERMARTEAHLFIYVGAIQAHVVPLAQLDPAEAERFVDALSSRISTRS
jgi:hypothetical protein